MAPEIRHTPRLVTAEELMAMGEGRRELIRGRVVEMSPAGGEHSWIGSRISRIVGVFVDERQLGGHFGADCGFVLERQPDMVRAPDFAFVAGLRGTQPVKRYVEGAPDLAVEVISPTDRRHDVEEKTRDWLDHGATEVWVVDPARRTVDVHRVGEPPRRLGIEDRLEGSLVLPGFSVAVSDCFPPEA